MRILRSKIFLVLATVLVAAALYFVFFIDGSRVDFNTEVKPIFNKKCISCHGGVKRKAGFSLLFRSEALAPTESGKPAIIPGNPNQSELIRRLTLSDPEERMPYKHEQLSKEEIGILTRWVRQGAVWGDHWAYVAVKPETVPDINDDWVKNDIDKFVLKKIQQKKIKPSSIADKATLLRRVSLDLIGMPAPESIANKFLSDPSDKAYENLVDSLLASKHYGERWSSLWLDLARYADTKGYERDDSRNIWRYRDWLIDAFNKDQPYDKFLTEQIAGDLLPNATDNQLIATAFHRNTMTNDEGGTDNEEYRTAAVLDRVNTTWETLMGTTFGCVQCHSHPYDPFRHDEYYKFVAFFNDSRDEDTEAEYPLLRHFPDTLQQELDILEKWLGENAGPSMSDSYTKFVKTWQPAVNSLLSDQYVNGALADTKWAALRNNGSCRLPQIDLTDVNELYYRVAVFAKSGLWKIHLDKPDGPVIAAIPLKNNRGMEILSAPIQPVNGKHDLYLSFYSSNLKSPDDTGVMFDWFWFTQKFPAEAKPGYEENRKRFWRLLTANVPTTPIMLDNPITMKRSTRVFERGNWLVKGDLVEPDVPHSLNPLPATAPKNRLGLAMWLTDKKNPLTARTMVNRLWEQVFGQGLVETLEDLGTQGIPPTHRELLDWMAYQFMNENQWSTKKLLKMMLMSATYQQSSVSTPDAIQKDPSNNLYARGPRVRLSAEQIRDQALVASSLLSSKIGGPSVFPHQPKGIWLSPYNGADWKMSEGEDKYRRALYTFWKRTAPYPSMMTFDGAARDVCASRRIRTNTPLQALVTLNDEAFIEMSRGLAFRMIESGGISLSEKINKGYEWLMFKKLDPEKLKILEQLYNQSLLGFKGDKEKTCEMVGVMNHRNNPETAAMVVVANAMLNMDEVIVKN